MARGGGPGHRFYSVLVFVVLASLDNVAIGLVPPLYAPISSTLGVNTSAIGLVTAISFLVSAIAAVGWAYFGDRTNRKPLLMIGTLLWAVGTAGSAAAGNYPDFFGAAGGTPRSSSPRRWPRSVSVPSARSGSRWSPTSSRPAAGDW